MDNQALESSIKVMQFQSNTRPKSAVNVKVPKKPLKSYIFPISRSQQNLKLQKFHPYSINIKSISKTPIQPLEISMKKIIPIEKAENSLKKQSFSLQSIPEKGQFLNMPSCSGVGESEVYIKYKNSRPSTARIVKNENLTDRKENFGKFLPKRGNECVNEMLKIWNSDKIQKIFNEESDEDLVQRDLLLRISDIDSYLSSEKHLKKPLHSSLYPLVFPKASSLNSFTNFGLKATKKPLSARNLKFPKQNYRHK